MTEVAAFRYRVTFGKTGRLALLSHLEVTHALERMVRRAQLPFAVTQGFSPHMKIGFGAALPVGVGSMCEVVDLYLTEYLPPSEVLRRLAEMSPADLRPTKAVMVSAKEPAASIAYPLSTYAAKMGCGGDIALPPELAVPETITVERNGKVKSFAVGDYLVGRPSASATEDGVEIAFTLRSSQAGSLRPDVFCERLCGENGLEGAVVSITRIAQSAE